MKKIFTIFSICTLCILSFSQNSEYLKIQNVNWWGTQDGSIDSITIMIEPKGMYAEVQLLVDYSTRGTTYSSGDSLEIQMGFHLPYEAEVTDLWLWFYEIPIQARMMDRWTATMIYESIVNRRQDPVLLLKNSDTYYDMKIFPLLTNMPRRIKLTYLLPFNRMTSSESSLYLPLNFLKLSSLNIFSTRICFRDTLNMTFPSIEQFPALNFTQGTDPYFGQCRILNLPSLSGINALSLKVSNNISTSSVYAGFYNNTSANENYFELEMNLKEIFNINNPKKTLFMFDFVQSNTTLSNHYVVNSFKNYVRNYYSEGDSINILISGLYSNFISSQWVSADSASLDQFLNTFLPSMINTSSNLPTLMLDGIDFIRNNGNDGNILLISSSSAYTSTNAANSLIFSVLTHMGNPKIPLNIISIDDKSYVSWGNNNVLYRGNQYLFSNLALMTGGEFEIILYATMDQWMWNYYYHYTSYENMLSSIIPKLSGYFTSSNVFVGLQSGFTYAVYDINTSGGFTYFDNPYRICGKYTGSFPIQLYLSAVDNTGTTYNSQLNIGVSEIIQLDSTLQHLWAGQFIRELYTYQQSNSIVNHIISVSRNERVLSKYTALLAIEPGMPFGDTIAVPIDNPDLPIINIEEVETQSQDNDNLCVVFPNPARDYVFFGLKFYKNTLITIELYNVLHQKIDIVTDIQMFAGSNTYSYNTSGLTTGNYFYRIISENEILFTGKIVIAEQ